MHCFTDFSFITLEDFFHNEAQQSVDICWCYISPQEGVLHNVSDTVKHYIK